MADKKSQGPDWDVVTSKITFIHFIFQLHPWESSSNALRPVVNHCERAIPRSAKIPNLSLFLESACKDRLKIRRLLLAGHHAYFEITESRLLQHRMEFNP